MRMHLLSGGRLRMRRSTYYPDAAREETFELPVSCALLKHPQGNLLFDTGCHPDAAVDPEGRWGQMVRIMTPIYTPQEAVVGQLPLAGLTANDIDVVVCSHFHADHCGCNSFFPRATLVCHAQELALAQSPEGPSKGYLRQEWEHGGPVETIDAQHDVFGDGRLTLLPVPGHSPGMTIAHVALEQDGAFILASDAVPVRENLERRFAPKNSWNVDLTVRALDEIARLEADGATVLFGHDDEQWRSVRKGEAFYA